MNYKSDVEAVDALAQAYKDLSEEIVSFIESTETPVLDFQTDEDITEAYLEFYSENGVFYFTINSIIQKCSSSKL